MTSFIDRTNLSFASVTMTVDLGMGPATYGLGAGLFSLGYAAAMIPSNVALLRLGAPTWLAALCLAWGVTAGAFAFVTSVPAFLALRLLLGVCESGSIPGVWAVVGQLYPPDRATVPLVVIETGITASQLLGAPLAAGLLALDGTAGLKGWQWVFFGEALPAVALSGLVFVMLPKSIAAASFLTTPQKRALEAAVAIASPAAAQPERPCTAGTSGGSGGGGGSGKAGAGPSTPAGAGDGVLRSSSSDGGDSASASECDPLAGGAAASPAARAAVAGRLRGRGRPASRCDLGAPPAAQPERTLACGRAGAGAAGEVTLAAVLAALRRPIVVYAGVWRVLHDIGGVGLLFFTPLIILALDGGAAPERVALLSALPYLVTSVVHIANGWHSQRTNERRLHLALCWAAGAAALLVLPVAMGPRGSPGAAFALLVVAHVGLNGANGVGTSHVSSFLDGKDKALSLAAYNTLGQLGAFAGPYMVGALRQSQGSYAGALGLMGACLGAAAALVLALDEAGAREGSWRTAWRGGLFRFCAGGGAARRRVAQPPRGGEGSGAQAEGEVGRLEMEGPAAAAPQRARLHPAQIV